jgi:P pilus assembly chaperone PapD
MLLGVYLNWQYHNIPKGVILGVIFPTNQSMTFLPNGEVLTVRNKGKYFVILLTFTFSGIKKKRQKQTGIYPY